VFRPALVDACNSLEISFVILCKDQSTLIVYVDVHKTWMRFASFSYNSIVNVTIAVSRVLSILKMRGIQEANDETTMMLIANLVPSSTQWLRTTADLDEGGSAIVAVDSD